MAEVEKSLERYEILHRIAVGGMAEVFLAKAYGAHGFEKTLAIKRILPDLAKDPEFEERFIAEAKVSVRLSHANIVQVLDFGRFSQSLFIAMEYVDGVDLATLLKRLRDRGQTLPLPAAFHIAVELARGLDFAHHYGVVHRDVSPSNILLSRAGEVKITDFGIAVAARAQKRATSGVRRIMGKWRYMSPEQARGDELDTRSDLFSAAVVMFELFTGQKLFPGDEAEEINRNIQEMTLPRPSQVRPELPAGLDEILMGALQRDPAARTARAATLQRALTELSYESSIVASALDVAEAVESVAEASSKASLDDLIRKQLVGALGGPTQTRRTAVEEDSAPAEPPPAVDAPPGVEVTGPTTLLHSVDADGVSILAPGEPTMAAAPQARRRETGPPPKKPVGSVAAVSPSAPAPVPTSRAAPASWRPGRWLLVGAVVVGLAAVGVVAFNAESTTAPRSEAVAMDAAHATPRGRLSVESDPAGATASIDGRSVGVTPLTIDVEAERALHVHMELAGHQPWDDRGVVVDRDGALRVRAVLMAGRARLAVTSDPPGATVELDGRSIGVTPLERGELEPHPGAVVTLSLPGFDRMTAKVDLVAGETARVDRALRAVQKFGAIDLQIDEGWAEVYLKGRAIGRAPAKGLRLPVGKHRLRLVNPPSRKEAFLDVEVTEGEVKYYRTKI